MRTHAHALAHTRPHSHNKHCTHTTNTPKRLLAAARLASAAPAAARPLVDGPVPPPLSGAGADVLGIFEAGALGAGDPPLPSSPSPSSSWECHVCRWVGGCARVHVHVCGCVGGGVGARVCRWPHIAPVKQHRHPRAHAAQAALRHAVLHAPQPTPVWLAPVGMHPLRPRARTHVHGKRELLGACAHLLQPLALPLLGHHRLLRLSLFPLLLLHPACMQGREGGRQGVAHRAGVLGSSATPAEMAALPRGAHVACISGLIQAHSMRQTTPECSRLAGRAARRPAASSSAHACTSLPACTAS